jgi:hypothetical protein
MGWVNRIKIKAVYIEEKVGVFLYGKHPDFHFFAFNYFPL